MRTVPSPRVATLLAVVLSLAAPLRAEPAAPRTAASVADLTFGIFCALEAMEQRPAPGTLAGWIHVPEGDIAFHWPDTRVVPAQIGLAFGVKSLMRKGLLLDGQMRVFRPGRSTPETWDSTFSDTGETFAFFRFDREDELLPGLWRFEAWSGSEQLYSVAFEVVPAEALPEIAQACGAVA